MGTTTWTITMNSTVRPEVGRTRCRLFEVGRGQTKTTAGDGEESSPVVIHQHPWILVFLTKLILQSV